MRVHAVALRSGRDAAENARLLVGAVKSAAADGAELVVLPEYAAAFDPRGVGADLAAPLDDGVVPALRAAARRAAVAVVAGTVVPDGELAANVVVVIGPDGEVAGTYRKVHLYDAFGQRESDRLVAGDPAAPPIVVPVGGLAVGVLTCYDLRFPESARRLVDAGAEVLAVPAAWAAGELKADHWETLLRARAIESTCAVVASAQQGAGVAGDSLVVSADGVVLARAGAGDGSRPRAAAAHLSADDVAAVRGRNPSLANRRYAVVPLAPGATPPVPAPPTGPEAPEPAEPAERSDRSEAPVPRRIWDRLYAAGLGLVGLLGLALVLAAGPATEVFDTVLFGGPGPVDGAAAVGYLAFVYRVLGAVLLGWAVLLAALGPRLRRRSRDAWRATVASLLVWYALDTVASLLSGFGANAVLNTVLAVALAVPLAGMRGELRPAPGT